MDSFTELKRDALARHLRRHIQGEVRFDRASRALYSTDASIYQIEPLGVVIPKTVEDLTTTVLIAGEMRIPITARGGGTSLSGQSIGPGIVLDCSKYLNQVLDIDTGKRVAHIQPGVVLDQLNRAVAGSGLIFGPEVATSSRANLGGMIGNNSAGARSIVYGKTIDHVRSLSVILADGTRTAFGPVSSREWEDRAASKTAESDIYRGVRQIARANAAEIERRFPRILRRVSGYNLDAFLNGEPKGPRVSKALAPLGSPLNLAHLIVGSEGTLALITEVELDLVPRPKVRGLLVPHFSSLAAAMDALPACLELQPSAVELLDHMMIALARQNLSYRDQTTMIRGEPAMLFMVEFSSDEAAEVDDRLDRLEKRLQGASGVEAVLRAVDPAAREPLWNLRRAGMPLLYGMKGDRKPITFVEDTAVPPVRLAEYTARFRDILRHNGTDGAFYGHASVGCLHIRPLLNLKDPVDVARMRHIAEEVTDLVLEFGGSLSGEHGDGLARSEWNKKMFGPVVYEAFRQVKHTFDPHNLFNPGKVVDAPSMADNLRYPPSYHPAEPATIFDYRAQEGFVRSIELCNGNGLCRKQQGGVMCPSFRATLDEKDSTRGRANALRLALAGDAPASGDALASGGRKSPGASLRDKWVYDVLDLCLMCKACKSECPSNVDMAKLKAEFLEFYYQDRSRPLGQALMARIDKLNRLAAPAAPVVNWLQNNRIVRWLMEKMAGIDRRRSLPALHAHHFRRWFARRRPLSSAGGHGRVLLLDDCFNTFNEPEVARAAVVVLERAGYHVELAGLTCCCRPLISKGFLREARDLIQKQVLGLARRLSDGTPLLGLEPSCLLTLADEWTELVPSPETKRIAAAAELAEIWLVRQVEAGNCTLKLQSQARDCVIHGHCHQKALRGMSATAAALRLVPALNVQVLDTGCCGMAGSFGFEKEHYDLSVKIAGLSLLPALTAHPDALLVAPGTSCRHQIKDLANRRALHPLEVLATNSKSV
jgi:FAD/FMN-containing dehydrogenase/Fe-S oxidoreductase